MCLCVYRPPHADWRRLGILSATGSFWGAASITRYKLPSLTVHRHPFIPLINFSCVNSVYTHPPSEQYGYQ